MADISKREKSKSFELFEESDITMMTTMMMMVVVMAMVLPSLLQGPVSIQSQPQSLSARALSYEGQEDPRILYATNILKWVNLIYDYPFRPWVSAFIINDGPSSVEIGINYPDDRFLMYPGETRTVTRTGAEERINILFYICTPGLTSTVRATGVY